MKTAQAPDTTLADMLGRAIAENDDGNLSHAAKKLRASRPTVYRWLSGTAPNEPRHIASIISYTGEDEDAVHRAIYRTRLLQDERARLIGRRPGYPGSPVRVLSFPPHRRPSLTVRNRALPVSHRPSTGFSALAGAA